jgi:hypothetical protein
MPPGKASQNIFNYFQQNIPYFKLILNYYFSYILKFKNYLIKNLYS